MKRKLYATFSTWVGTTAIGAKHYYVRLKEERASDDDRGFELQFAFQYKQEAHEFVGMLAILLKDSKHELVFPPDFEEWDVLDGSEAWLRGWEAEEED